MPVLTKSKVIGPRNLTITVTARYDDECGNGHDTFAITADITKGKRFEDGGCLHDEIAKHFPELRKYIKWHLTSEDGPLHYIANTVYWAEQGNLEYARSCAVAPDATLDQLADKEWLQARLPGLLEEFNADMEELFNV